MATYREGFTIDTVGKFASKTILNPYLTLPAAGALASPKVLSYLVEKLSLTAPATAKLTKYVRLFAALSALHNLNNFLTAQSANNWSRDDSWDWDKEIVLLTGGSSGIGENIAKMLIARNPRTKIIIFDFAPLTWAPPSNSNIAYYQIDLTDTAALKVLCERIRQEVGHPTVLINNAGLARGETICGGSYADVEITVKTNLIAPILLCKEFVPEMARRNHGHVVNVASASALVSPSELGDYAATKAGVVMLHETLQLELKNKHNAPKVRTSVGIFMFIRTPLFRGETGQSNFLTPLLHVETVAEAIVNTIYSGKGRTIYLPGMMRYVAVLRGLLPEWAFRKIRDDTKRFKIDFRGRHKLDDKGKLDPTQSRDLRNYKDKA